MSDRYFIDNNSLIYLYSESEEQKRKIICNVIDLQICITSTQALNEASNVWVKKFKWEIIKVKKHLDNIEQVCDEVALIRRNTIDIALNLNARYKYSYYDCLMLASSLENGCSIILTEDMRDGQLIDGRLNIVNPFI